MTIWLMTMAIIEITAPFSFAATLYDNLLSYWQMDDNAADTKVAASIGVDGTATANTSTLQTTGKINGALRINGTNYITTPYINFGANDFTVSL